jgi:manganese efflux pump family protein
LATTPPPQARHGWRLLVSGAALSLDDFAVGLAPGALAIPVVAAVVTFGVFSAVLTLIRLELGAKLGLVTGECGEVVAAILLLCLAGAMAMDWL